MTFMETCIFALENMIFVLLIKRIAQTKFFYNIVVNLIIYINHQPPEQPLVQPYYYIL